MAEKPPLCVDLDGTLVLKDTTGISFGLLLRQSRWHYLSVLAWLLRGRAHAKQEIARRVDLDPARLPYNQPFLAFLRQERAQGRRLVLATGSDRSIAAKVAQHLGIFDQVLASDGVTNLTAERKAQALVERFGPGGFDYAGDHRKDLPVWRQARLAILVNASRQIRAQVLAECINHLLFQDN
ncbi:MAG: haloacid dehalogenase-like hydrolase [Pseudomonadota bacterium]